jgi:hypothetical protein
MPGHLFAFLIVPNIFSLKIAACLLFPVRLVSRRHEWSDLHTRACSCLQLLGFPKVMGFFKDSSDGLGRGQRYEWASFSICTFSFDNRQDQARGKLAHSKLQ